MRKGAKTAAELMAELNADPNFQRRRRDKEKKKQQLSGQLDQVMCPIISRLSESGFSATTLHELVRNHAPLNSDAVGILLSSLGNIAAQDVSNDIADRARESVIRALTAAAAPFDGKPLLHAFESTNNYNLQWVIINAVACCKPHSISDWVRSIRAHPTWGQVLEDLESS